LASNEEFFGQHVSISDSVTAVFRNVLFDPQTSGGLLIFCEPPAADALITQLQAEGIEAVEIGLTTKPGDHLLTVT
jgi:selenide,water dikinase